MTAMLTTSELCQALHVAPVSVKRWRESGMPCVLTRKGYRFDSAKVETWLQSQGKLVPRGDRVGADVLTTDQEAAGRFDCSVRTIRDWKNSPGFPGRTGYFPVVEIQQWLADRPGQRRGRKHPEVEAAERELMDRTIREKDLKLMKLQGELMPIRLAVETVGQIVSQCSAMLDEFPPLVLSEYSDADAAKRSSILTRATAVVERFKQRLRELPQTQE